MFAAVGAASGFFAPRVLVSTATSVKPFRAAASSSTSFSVYLRSSSFLWSYVRTPTSSAYFLAVAVCARPAPIQAPAATSDDRTTASSQPRNDRGRDMTSLRAGDNGPEEPRSCFLQSNQTRIELLLKS